MNNVDKQYLALMRDILENGSLKHTRAGDTLSVFGKSMEFNLQEGFPLLTTKRMHYKGIFHELLWFLKGDTNIKYLIENGVHIWDDDAYRWYKELIDRSVEPNTNHRFKIFNDKGEVLYNTNNSNKIKLDKETFLNFVKVGAKLKIRYRFPEQSLWIKRNINYRFGDLGPVYGKQWRKFGKKNVDQINNIINSLKNNPDDRRMLCVAFNPDVLGEVALPPCHVMFQFYSRELTQTERNVLLQGHNPNKELPMEELDKLDIPKRELSLSFNMRSNDFCLGNPYNIASYALLCHIIADICNMSVGKLIFFGGDVHIYTNQLEGCEEQLKREGYDELPTLIIKRKLENVDDITIDDFEIRGYKADSAIKFPLSVG